ncbi:MAG: insulinase family protein [Bacteroidaceae bacterium]|nr:insulinase family protein [Bacteroidaceae bacterium]
MKKLFVLFVAGLLAVACGPQHDYETVEGDPMGVRIYTLKNGLKVYTSVNRDAPRLEAYVAVRAGSKNDPAATTGLAHYFEHLMFKGTEQLGTQDFAKEKPLLDEVEALFEQYRQTTDETERKAIYHRIDSISYEASKLAIPNEYDKVMAAIGGSGSNAFTSYDVTCYTEDIPSNQIENWAKIQADRFAHPILRGFHTELETVYEEFNMYASDDNMKMLNALLASLFPGHPYSRDVIGLPEHLKNPSITSILNFHKQWYVPNNMAVILSGDFDPDEAVAAIEKYFGELAPSDSLPELDLAATPELTAPKDTTVYGLEREFVSMAWALPGANSAERTQLEMLGEVLCNGNTGLLDFDLNQRQAVLNASAGVEMLADHGVMFMEILPKEGQTLEQLKEMALVEMKKLRDGDFDDALLEGILNNFKRRTISRTEDARACAMLMLNSFVNGTNWTDEVKQLEAMKKVTKQDIVALAGKYLRDDNYVTVFKRQSATSNQKKIAKPQLTPIETNRDTASAFLKEIQNTKVKPIEPRFLNFQKDLSVAEVKSGLPLYYKQNETNDLFTLEYVFERGCSTDKALKLAADYIDYLGTSDMSPEEIKSAFYRMACTMTINPGMYRTTLTLRGLDENMDECVKLFEKLLTDCQVNAEAYANLVKDELKNRVENKADKSQVSDRLRAFLTYGEKNHRTHLLTTAELTQMNPQELVDRLHMLTSHEHRVLYYGPRKQQAVIDLLKTEHKVPAKLLTDAPQHFTARAVTEPTVFLVDYDDNQSDLTIYNSTGLAFDPARVAVCSMYSEYFGGGMNAIVFQELRERRSLAYSAWDRYVTPDYASDLEYHLSGIGTQNDKLLDALAAFTEILTDMPQSEPAFSLAKENVLTRLRTRRVTKMNVLSSYIDAQDFGLDYDLYERLFNEVQSLTLQDVVAFQQANVKGKPSYYGVLGRKSDLDLEALAKYGKLQWLTLETIFGY